MRNRMLIVLSALLLTISFLPASGQQRKAATLAQLRASYLKQQAAIDNDALQQQVKLKVDYKKVLSKLEAFFTTSGELESTLLVREEGRRFIQTADVPLDALVSEPEQLKRMQATFRTTRDSVEMGAAKKTVDLAGKYKELLELQLKTLTKAGQIEDAVKVKPEIERIDNDAKLLAATELVKNANPAKIAAASGAEMPTVAGTLYANCPGRFEVVLNGKRIMTGRKGETQTRRVSLKAGDMLSTKCFDDGAGDSGFVLLFVPQNGTFKFSSNTRDWFAYEPANKVNWWKVAERGKVKRTKNQESRKVLERNVRVKCEAAIWADDGAQAFLAMQVTDEHLKPICDGMKVSEGEVLVSWYLNKARNTWYGILPEARVIAAKAMASAFGADMVVIKNEEENEWIRTAFQRDGYRTGLLGLEQTGGAGFKWRNDQRSEYYNWDEGSSEQIPGNIAAMNLRSGTWLKRRNDQRTAAIIEMSKMPPSKLPTKIASALEEQEARTSKDWRVVGDEIIKRRGGIRRR